MSEQPEARTVQTFARWLRGLIEDGQFESESGQPGDAAAEQFFPGEPRDRATLAVLRNALRQPPGAYPPAFRLVYPHLPGGLPPHRENPYFLVASLFALHRIDWRRGEAPAYRRNLGASFGWLKHLGDAKANAEALDARFTALLDSDQDQLAPRLRSVITLLKRDDVPVDWELLLGDLLNWTQPDRRVQRAWARSFWGFQPTAAAPPTVELTPANPDPLDETPVMGGEDR